MKPNRFGLSSPAATLVLLVIYLVVVIDVVTGLNLNLFGYGREPLLFSIGAVVIASCLYAGGRPALGMIGLVFCCAWLVFYPAKNGFDVVLSPLLATGFAMWMTPRMWQKLKPKP
jgi:hypothetical protein